MEGVGKAPGRIDYPGKGGSFRQARNPAWYGNWLAVGAGKSERPARTCGGELFLLWNKSKRMRSSGRKMGDRLLRCERIGARVKWAAYTVSSFNIGSNGRKSNPLIVAIDPLIVANWMWICVNPHDRNDPGEKW